MTLYYDKENKCFYDSAINVDVQASDTVIEITAEQHANLLNALNSGCIIFEDLTYSDPKPEDGIYNFDYKKKEWALDKDATRKAQVPNSISRFQAMSVLEETEIDFNGERTTIANATQNYIDSLDNSTAENRAIKRAWNYANEFERESETIKAIADLLNLSDEYVDNLYIQASKIKG